MPRRPTSSFGLPFFGNSPPRLSPPQSLGPLEKQRFLDLVLSCPSGQFRASDLPILCRHVELTLMAEQAAGELQAQGMVVDDKPSPWLAVYLQVTNALLKTAARLHLSPSARGHAVFAAEAEPPASYYDRQALLLEADDEEVESSRPHGDGARD